MSNQSVFIIDPDHASREQVERVTKALNVPVQSFSSAEAFLRSLPDDPAGCLVTEFRLLGISGVELQESLVSKRITLPIIFVTSHAETSLTVRAMNNGAITVLEKPLSEQELWDAASRALSRDHTIRRIDARHNDLRRRLSGLTQKEWHVVDLILKGKTNKAIAAELDVSIRTIEARRHQIFRKTCTNSIAELVRMVVCSGRCEEEEDSHPSHMEAATRLN